MKYSRQRRTAAEEEESAFVSMTDMTVSILFIVIILLAFFARFYGNQDTDVVPRPWFTQSQAERDDAREERDTARTERDKALTDLDEANALLADAYTEIERLKKLLANTQVERDALLATVEEQNSVIEERETTIAGLTKQIEDKDLLILSLQKQLEEARAEIETLKAKIAKLQESIRDPLEKYLASADATRLRILHEIENKLKVDFPDLEVKINERNGALQFKGEGLFHKGARELMGTKRAVMARVGTMLDELLPCYTLGAASRWGKQCNPAYAVIEAIQIEGHTDSEGTEIYNLRLSNDRAVSAFTKMTDAAPGLITHQNLREQPVISVAGYGEYRPIASNDTKAGEDENRRIDLRIIMFAPTNTDQIEELQTMLNKAAERPDETE